MDAFRLGEGGTLELSSELLPRQLAARTIVNPRASASFECFMARFLLNPLGSAFYQQDFWRERTKTVKLCVMASQSSSVLPEIEGETSNQLQPLYHVILLNDEDHTYDYVIEMLQKTFGFSEATAFSHAIEVDTKGTTILITCEL